MAKIQIKISGFQCERCGHKWIPRTPIKYPKVCPKCKSPYWDRPRLKDHGRSSNHFQGKITD